MKQILITIVIGILISALLYYFFVYSCEKDNTHEFDYLNFECLEKNNTKQPISTPSTPSAPSPPPASTPTTFS